MISASRKDILWNYIGTIVSMASGFVLLPLLLYYLSDDELGLWYVYLAVANLALLFEFGFNATFSRNIVFVISGAQSLSAQGKARMEAGVNWHLLNVVIRASKLIYAVIAAIVFIGLAFGGSAYVFVITNGLNIPALWPSWLIFLVAIVSNLYFFYSSAILRGYGDVAGENRARTFAKAAQLALSALLLFFGLGLVGASLGYLANSILLRLFSIVRIRSHKEIERGRASDGRRIDLGEVKAVLGTMSHLAWRDGIVSLATYVSTQGIAIMSSVFLGLAETGTYSVLLQLASAVGGFACAYPKSFFPSMQSAFVEGRVEYQKEVVSRSIVAFWALIFVGAIGVCLVVLPLLPLFNPGIDITYPLFLLLVVYLALLQQHSIFCSYVISMNEIPYMLSYTVAALMGLGLVGLMCGLLGWGVWGIMLGQMVSQLLYNNWKWPKYLCGRLGVSYWATVKSGISYWLGRAIGYRGMRDSR